MSLVDVGFIQIVDVIETNDDKRTMYEYQATPEGMEWALRVEKLYEELWKSDQSFYKAS